MDLRRSPAQIDSLMHEHITTWLLIRAIRSISTLKLRLLLNHKDLVSFVLSAHCKGNKAKEPKYTPGDNGPCNGGDKPPRKLWFVVVGVSFNILWLDPNGDNGPQTTNDIYNSAYDA